MTDNVIEFLRTVAGRPGVLDSLKARSKHEVLAAAAGFGLPFSENDFNTLVWDLEMRLAQERGEQFDSTFPLWHVMWGKTYLEYVVVDLIPSLEEKNLI
ncbi:Nif11-like leader peptide family natural product precursor [Kutzneria chonburiensis]|uniref:Nif11-like leader peptide family natural product n=1 Tax=Kutzneria chonburiensis TaxID=1483604 RepID=A0ABV6MWZ9_9PSEU|nr:Nif11-like leader peptide family natural product precursor [Kutzneria chonburiensis]